MTKIELGKDISYDPDEKGNIEDKDEALVIVNSIQKYLSTARS